MNRIKQVALVFLILLVAYALVSFGLIVSATSNEADAGADYLIVLGAKVSRSTPAVPSKQLQERLDEAITYLEKSPDTTVIVTGGQGSDEGEAEAIVMERYLLANGIGQTNILVENRSTSTIQNFKYSLDLLDLTEDEIESKRFVVVTNDYHLYRSKRTAKLQGLEHIEGIAARSRSSSTLKSYAREIVALGYHLIFTR